MTVVTEGTAQLESGVRFYDRQWPAVFDRASGARLETAEGTSYLDFFTGAGALSYGHANPHLKQALLRYIERDGLIHSLDMATVAKRALLSAIHERLLAPRGLDHVVQFTGPTGTNAVEAALKVARLATGRTTIAAFTRSFHGVSLGSLAATASLGKRAGAGVPLEHVLRLPYERPGPDRMAGPDLLDDLLGDPGSGVEPPAAVLVETVQGEGGVNVASSDWLQRLAATCERWDVVLIVDDIQVGCGRTGPFFSFEEAGIVPDVICLSKALSGYGLPLAVTLLRPALDVWSPGQHNGTFRGSNPGFVTATTALETYWADDTLRRSTEGHAMTMEAALRTIADEHAAHRPEVRGRGLIWGLELPDPGVAGAVAGEAFARGLLVETSGPGDEVVKLLPPLTASRAELEEGLEVLSDATTAVLTRARGRRLRSGGEVAGVGTGAVV